NGPPLSVRAEDRREVERRGKRKSEEVTVPPEPARADHRLGAAVRAAPVQARESSKRSAFDSGHEDVAQAVLPQTRRWIERGVVVDDCQGKKQSHILASELNVPGLGHDVRERLVLLRAAERVDQSVVDVVTSLGKTREVDPQPFEIKVVARVPELLALGPLFAVAPGCEAHRDSTFIDQIRKRLIVHADVVLHSLLGVATPHAERMRAVAYAVDHHAQLVTGQMAKLRGMNCA